MAHDHPSHPVLQDPTKQYPRPPFQRQPQPAPGLARAKPYPEDPTPFPEGDPTADDQPSPTPKKSAGFTSRERYVVHQNTLSGRKLPYGGRMTWDLYLRVLSRLIVR